MSNNFIYSLSFSRNHCKEFKDADSVMAKSAENRYFKILKIWLYFAQKWCFEVRRLLLTNLLAFNPLAVFNLLNVFL